MSNPGEDQQAPSSRGTSAIRTCLPEFRKRHRHRSEGGHASQGDKRTPARGMAAARSVAPKLAHGDAAPWLSDPNLELRYGALSLDKAA
jgi:hypothetical protein